MDFSGLQAAFTDATECTPGDDHGAQCAPADTLRAPKSRPRARRAQAPQVGAQTRKGRRAKASQPDQAIGVRLPGEILDFVQFLCSEKGFVNRSDAIRSLLYLAIRSVANCDGTCANRQT